MMKVRVFKKPDGSVIYSIPTSQYQNLDNFEGCKFPDFTEGLPYVDLQQKEIPKSNSETGDYHEMIYFDGDCKKGNLKQDKDWVECLMPPFLIKQKYIQKLNEKLDVELKQESPSLITIAKTQQAKEICGGWKDKDWFKQAYSNIEERVKDGESDKPIIREKLIKKIEELS